jgi:hypothetical protein
MNERLGLLEWKDPSSLRQAADDEESAKSTTSGRDSSPGLRDQNDLWASGLSVVSRYPGRGYGQASAWKAHTFTLLLHALANRRAELNVYLPA